MHPLDGFEMATGLGEGKFCARLASRPGEKNARSQNCVSPRPTALTLAAVAKLSDLDKEIIRRAPGGFGSIARLAALFEVSRGCIEKIRSGERGLPGQNGLGSRPWVIRSRELVETWRTRQLARVEAAYRRALERIDSDQPITLEPTTEEALSRLPGAPGSLVLFKGALALKPQAPPPPAPTARPIPARRVGLMYDRR